MQFQGKTALVTGGASGIGRAAALAFAKEGAQVVVADINGQGAQATADQIRAAGGSAVAVVVDVSVESQVIAMVEQAKASFGKLDYAFNNAGFAGAPTTVLDCTEEQWDRTMAVNAKGIWLSMKYEIPLIIASGGGAIVNTASFVSLVGLAGIPAYAASKGAVASLTRVAALEHTKSGVRINAICPGVVDTGMLDGFVGGDQAAKAAFAALEPIGRTARPEEIAATALWLCSDASSFVLGAMIDVTGGILTQ